MEINNTSSNAVHNPYQERAQAEAAKSAVRGHADSAAYADSGVSDRVSLSDEALAQSSDDLDTDGGNEQQSGSGATTGKAVKAFVYGTLGLERPKTEAQEKEQEQQQQQEPAAAPEKTSDEYYNAGRWLAAAATVGTIVSLLA
jgi:hypothetical protein